MSNLILNDNVIGGSSNDSSDILYTPNDNRVETNVQAELDKINTDLAGIFEPDIYNSYPGLNLIKFGPIVIVIFKGYIPLNSTLTIPEKYRPSAQRVGNNVVTIMGLLYASEGSCYTANADITCATGKVAIAYKDSIYTRSNNITTPHGFYGNGVWVTD